MKDLYPLYVMNSGIQYIQVFMHDGMVHRWIMENSGQRSLMQNARMAAEYVSMESSWKKIGQNRNEFLPA